jgi:hypothetical protein
VAQAIFAAVPATIIPAIVAPRGWPEEKQAAWSMLFFTLPAMMESLVALVRIVSLIESLSLEAVVSDFFLSGSLQVFLLQHVNRSFTALARARVNAESRKVSSGSELGAEAKKDR